MAWSQAEDVLKRKSKRKKTSKIRSLGRKAIIQKSPLASKGRGPGVNESTKELHTGIRSVKNPEKRQTKIGDFSTGQRREKTQGRGEKS